MLDYALAHLKGKIQARKIQIALLELFDNAQRVQIVIERTAVRSHERVQLPLSGVTKRGMGGVVHQREGFGKLGVEPQGGGHRASNLRHFQSVGQTIPEVVGETRGEYLRLGFQAAECTGMNDAVAISRVFTAVRMCRLRITPPSRMLRAHTPGRQCRSFFEGLLRLSASGSSEFGSGSSRP